MFQACVLSLPPPSSNVGGHMSLIHLQGMEFLLQNISTVLHRIVVFLFFILIVYHTYANRSSENFCILPDFTFFSKFVRTLFCLMDIT